MKGESSIVAAGCNGGLMGRGELMASESSCRNIGGVEILGGLGDMGREGLGVEFDANISDELSLSPVVSFPLPLRLRLNRRRWPELGGVVVVGLGLVLPAFPLMLRLSLSTV